jgi:FixJ family two-component response regulator
MTKPILIIADDNQAMRWLVRSACRPHFDEILEAHDGRQLFWELVRCSRLRPASEVVVITDVRMPTYSGLEVIAAYEELGYHPRTVVITSFPDPSVRAETELLGGVLLPKPFTTVELRRVVERVQN